MVLHPLPPSIVLDRFPELTEADLRRMRVTSPPLQTVAMNANLRYACRAATIAKGLGLAWPRQPNDQHWAALGTAVSADKWGRLLIIAPASRALQMWKDELPPKRLLRLIQQVSILLSAVQVWSLGCVILKGTGD
jgi:hypothetical protein